MQRATARLFSATALAAVALAATASGASAAALTLQTPCVRPNDPVKFSLAGYAADSTVNVTTNGEYLSEVTVGAAGDFTGQFNSGGLGDAFYAKSTLVGTDAAGNSASAALEIAALGVVAKPISTKPTTKVSYYAQGFVEGGTLYAHYTFSKSDTVKKHLKTVALGQLTGACGAITTKKVTQLPIKKAKKGLYEIQFDTSKTYKRQQGVYAETTIFLTKNQAK
jgi:hypothetical protein